MKFPVKAAVAAAIAIGGMAMASTASAAIVCNAENECWHVRGRYTYKPEWNIVVHPNNWRWGAAEHYRWREHTGRGYWDHGSWHRF